MRRVSNGTMANSRSLAGQCPSAAASREERFKSSSKSSVDQVRMCMWRTWFALDHSRPLAFFARLRASWTCVRKLNEGEVCCELFAFLTTEPNREIDAVHPQAMPVILTEPGATEAWLTLLQPSQILWEPQTP